MFHAAGGAIRPIGGQGGVAVVAGARPVFAVRVHLVGPGMVPPVNPDVQFGDFSGRQAMVHKGKGVSHNQAGVEVDGAAAMAYLHAMEIVCDVARMDKDTASRSKIFSGAWSIFVFVL